MSEETTGQAKALQKQAAKAERRLIERAQLAEQKLEKARKRLEDAESRLARAEDRLHRRQQVLHAAEATARDAQAARAFGPSAPGSNAVTNGLATEPLAPPMPTAAFPEPPTAATETATPSAERAD